MNSDMRRARALARDEARLRQALERHRANRFDIEAVRQVRLSVEGLMETLEALVHDGQFWANLEGHVLEGREIDALSSFDDAALGALLTVCGYLSPPPPSVDDLIADTRYAASLALSGTAPAEQVAEARRRLVIFLFRTRRQIMKIDKGEAEGASTVARRLGAVARKYIPVVASVAAGAAMEMALPTGLGLGLATAGVTGLLTRTIEKGAVRGTEEIAKRAAGWAFLTVVGDTLIEPPPRDDEAQAGALATPDKAVAAHVAIAQHLVSRLREDREAVPGPLLTALVAHLDRAVELSLDHGGSAEVEGAAVLALEIVMDARYRGLSDEELGLVGEALELCDIAYKQQAEVFGDLLGPDVGRRLSRLRERWGSHAGSPSSAQAVGDGRTQSPAIGSEGGWTTRVTEAAQDAEKRYRSY